MAVEVAYWDEQGWPHAANGSVIIDIGGGVGAGTAPIYDPTQDPRFIDFMQGPAVDAGSMIKSLPSTLHITGGIGGLVTNISQKTGLPEWAIIAAAAATAIYALHELGD